MTNAAFQPHRMIILIMLVLLSGCSLARTITTVTTPKGEVYTVSSKSDAMVEFQGDGWKLIVDNRGRPGIIEQALGIMFMNLPDVTIGANGD